MENGKKKSGRPSKSGSKAFTEIFRKLIGEATQQEAAEKIGVTRQNVGRWLAGINVPDIEALEKIADAYEVSTDYLLGRTTVKTPNIELKAICDYTQLSETTIQHLHGISPLFSREDDTYFFELEIIALNSLIEKVVSSRVYIEMAMHVDKFLFIEEFDRCALKKYCSEYNVQATETEIYELSKAALLNDPKRFPQSLARGDFDFELYKQEQIRKYDVLIIKSELLKGGNDYIKFLLKKNIQSFFNEALNELLDDVCDTDFFLKKEKDYREYFDKILFLSEKGYSDYMKERMDIKLKLEKDLELLRSEWKEEKPKGVPTHADHNSPEE